jgi:signal transduction histidine kinase
MTFETEREQTMDGSGKTSQSYRFNLKAFIVVVAVIWTLVIAFSWLWNVRQAQRSTVDEALVQARVAYEKDITYRRWNTMHGGVYARITDKTRPNPYLLVPEREVETVTGMRLTLINPAYMTRQANELADPEFGFRGHITSLNPLRPENFPDNWETEALKTFEEGRQEASSVETLNGGEYMRLMRPLVTEEGCLRCHASQGYRTGDIRGGISVAISMAPLRAIEKRNVFTLTLAHALFWVLGMAGHLFGARRLVRSEEERRQAEENTQRYALEIGESNRLKDLFIDIMRHDLLNPAGVIKCYVSYLIEGETDPHKKDLATKIDMANNKLVEMIENASKYSRLEDTETIECSRQDLNGILRESVLLVTCQIDGGAIKVDYLPEGEYPAWVNPMLGDVFVNLTSNAAKYAAAGKKIEVGIIDDGPSWKVYVKDFGPGISDDDKKKIFNRFERLDKEVVKGTGLGLAIARRVVDLHRGRLWVEDNPEGGSIFFVSLSKDNPDSNS